MVVTFAAASATATFLRPSTIDLTMDCIRKTPRTATTVIEMTSVLVTTWSWSDRRQTPRAPRTARRAHRRTPRAICRGLLRPRFFAGAGIAGRPGG
ncbi:hypothetical protein Misp02_00890 [Microtetraspora sp. NBRC 16547]|nr:hypothetical protein Misp02_00890 [Microtetraspora sp. NBRC 16547]